MTWQIRLLGAVRVRCGAREHTRFESSRVVALLARLALFPDRLHPREELVELLWPEVDPEVGRNRLRTALSSLRKQLEPPGSAGSLFLIERSTLGLNPAAVTCDARALERAIRQRRWSEARALNQGELLPGFYDDWVLQERDRLTLLTETIPEPAPPLTTAPTLPTYLTTFIGRGDEAAALETLLRSHRLVTLIGPGGMGKTRLSVEVARRLAPAFERCHFVPLDECRDPQGLTECLRGALGLPGGIGPVEALSDQKTLLVLDNFEQLVAGDGARQVELLLAKLPELTCLVTSRRLLELAGERPFLLQPLALATEAEPERPAVALFLDRAHACHPALAVTAHNRTDLLAIGALLEGVPLAIELAASQLRRFSLGELREQLTQRYAALSRPGPTGTDERHHSLASTVAWSWQLLTPRLQAFLSALSLFRGGVTAEAAATVTGEPAARDLLEELVAASLVVAEDPPAGPRRFRLLEMIRGFVAGQLPAPRQAELRAAHSAYYLDWSARQGYRVYQLATEAQNLQAALESALESGALERAVALLEPMHTLWELQGGVEQHLPLLGRLLERTESLPTAHSRALIAVGALLLTIADEHERARGYLEAALRSSLDPAQEARALRALVHLEWIRYHESPDSSCRLERALTLARTAGASGIEASLLNLCGILSADRDRDYEAAERAYTRAQALYEALGDGLHANYLLFNRANAALKRGETLQALAYYGRCRQVCQSLGDRVLEVDVANSTGAVLVSLERWAEAQAEFETAVRRAWEQGYRYMLVYALWNIAEPLVHRGDAARAALLLGFAEHYWDAHFAPLTPEDQDYLARLRALCAEAIGVPRTQLLGGQGSALTLRDAVSLVLHPTS